MIDALARASSFAGALVVIGAVPARALLRHAWRDPAHDAAREAALPRLARTAFYASLLLPLAAAFALHDQAKALVDDGETLAWAQYQLALASSWAWVWKAQVAAALLAVIAWVPWRGRPFVGPGLAPVAALVLAATVPMMGHPRVLPTGATLGILTGALHLLGAGIWLGTLAHLAVVAWVGPSEGRVGRLSTLVSAFSPLALAGAACVGFTGVVTAWQTVGSVGALFTSTYGRTLLLKLGTMGAILVLGAYNWRVAQPRLARGEGDDVFRRSAYIELSLGVVLL
ncbi:MAG TPA: CopD family protein, partial [Gemmatimonadales bacterium]|nr:CopD family protein [Gemmatimonadales bacterium]